MLGNYDFQAQVIRLGTFTLVAGIIANFIPALYLAAVLGVMPQWGDLIQVWVVAFGAFGASWIVQPLSFYPMLGTGGSYIGWLCGNVADLRVPAATMAQKVTGSEHGTPRGDVMATIGIAGSVFVSVFILTFFTFTGAAVMPLVPSFVKKAFGFILPAVVGAVYAELSGKHLKIGLGTILVALVITYLAPKFGIAPWLLSLCVIAGGMLVARWQFLINK
ncbi:hypothetical protein [Acetonema longum]|uniref:Uncharacterized protein n=1 Tax=Acetonema longum DSM 6540 TaxID=1009370 RepID=F7NKQ7_9FIRM|nr:hypothetical protein [Acetonema longum]EGO63361.1 hypothetical protein ALO_13379 [Acetonema longum DSM 6540]